MMRLSLLSTVAATAVAFSVPLARAQTNGTAPYKSILGLWYDSADCTGIPNVILTPVGPDSTTKYVWDTSLSDCYTTYVASGEPSLTSTNAAAGPDRCNMLNFLGVCRAGDQTQETGSYLQKLVGDWTTLPHAGTPSGPKPSLFPDEILKDSAAANRPYIVSSQVGPTGCDGPFDISLSYAGNSFISLRYAGNSCISDVYMGKKYWRKFTCDSKGVATILQRCNDDCTQCERNSTLVPDKCPSGASAGANDPLEFGYCTLPIPGTIDVVNATTLPPGFRPPGADASKTPSGAPTTGSSGAAASTTQGSVSDKKSSGTATTWTLSSHSFLAAIMAGLPVGLFMTVV